MNCPQCNVILSMSNRQGIEIDYCPQCRGIWLDRGELDKLIEKSNQFEQNQPNFQQEQKRPQQFENPKYYKRKHWLNELFD